MIDREKVIKGLECCLNADVNDCEMDCPYFNDCGGFYSNNTAVMADAFALLKAQEPCEDWISRKRLKDEIQYYIDEAGWGEEVNKALGWCLEFIDKQEAVK